MTSLTQTLQLPYHINDTIIEYKLRRSRQAKYIRFSVDAQGRLTITVPFGTTAKLINEILLTKRGWLEKHLGVNRLPQRDLVNGQILPCCGQEYRLELVNGDTKFIKLVLQGQTIRASIPPNSSGQIRNEMLKQALEAWYKNQARSFIEHRTKQLNREFGFVFNRITIRDQKTRWGSCSQLKNLNFNWRLVLAPLEVLDYVIIHELAHLQELNHSARFWQLVERACPNYRQNREWLRLHGNSLNI